MLGTVALIFCGVLECIVNVVDAKEMTALFPIQDWLAMAFSVGGMAG